MGVRFECPNGHKLNVKAHLAGERGICPECGARFIVPGFSGGRVDEAPSANDSAVALEMSFSDAPALKSGAGNATAAADAVAWYVRPASGGQYGPVETSEFKQWIADGRVAASAWVWRTGWADWKSGAEALQTMAPEKPRVPTPPPPPMAPRTAAAPVAPKSRGPMTPAPMTPAPVAAAPTPMPQAEPTFDLGDDWPPAASSNGAALPSQPDGLQAQRRRQRQFNQRLTLILGVVAMVLLIVLVIVLSRPTTTEAPGASESGTTINAPAEDAGTEPAGESDTGESTPAEEAAEAP